MRREPKRTAFCVTMALAVAVAASQSPAEDASPSAGILKESGVKGGLVVHLGCGDGTLTAELRANDRYLVQGLDKDPANIEKARAMIRARGLYGSVSVDQLRGDTLPYADNLVNLVILSSPWPVGREEILRVLCPGGVALAITQDGRPTADKLVKPWPAELDEWTHYLHGPGNNAVSRDQAVDVLKRLQWVGSPRFSRHHDHMSSISACVSAGGRVFYIIDEGSRASIYLPPHWQLVARDAFNGVILWKRPIADWHTHLQGLKSGPPGLPRRLVAVGDRVYVTLGIDAPVSRLDAATGELLREYAETAGTRQVLCEDGVLYLVTDERVLAVSAEDGSLLWQRDSPGIVTNTLAAGRQSVFYFDGQHVRAISAETGEAQWQSESLPADEAGRGGFAPTLVVVGDTVLFSGGDKNLGSDMGRDGTMTALDAATGRTLWQAPHPPSGYQSPEDLLVIGDLAWCGNTTHHGVGSPWERSVEGRTQGSTGVFTGRSLRTGEVVRTIESPDDYFWFHHRCHPGKATERFLLMSRTGIEFIDVAEGDWTMHHWARGACLYGIMPANGMVYAPQHPCACYLMAKISGFCALAPASTTSPAPTPETDRLLRGPAYEAMRDLRPEAEDSAPSDWPMYRRDPERSGYTPHPVGTKLVEAWRHDLPGAVTAPVVAGDRLFAAVPGEHAVYALDARDGRELWVFTAGGPVDSPPTCARGRLVFGCNDGCIYCLEAGSGKLIWRYQAAPTNRRHIAFEEIESTHPVHGSVLVMGDKVYAVAGRYRFLDGGLRYVVLNLADGTPVSETVLGEMDAETGRPFQAEHDLLNMPTATPDVLVSDGRTIFMKNQPLTLDGKADRPAVPGRSSGDGPAHLLCPTGLLDDSFWHRSYWVYGTTFLSGYSGYYVAGKTSPAGRVLAFNGDTVFGYGRRASMYRWTSPMEYTLFAARKDAPTVTESTAAGNVKGEKGEAAAKRQQRDSVQQFERLWEYDCPLQVRAMALAGDRLLVLGVLDVLDETSARDNPEGWALQEEHMAGKHGSVLWVVDAASGGKLAEMPLDFLPTFDGMACADGRLYITGADGSIACLAQP